MKLNIDTIKALLAFIEESPNFPEPIYNREIQLDGIDPISIHYHLCQMLDAGLIQGYESKATGRQYVAVSRLTWEGHAFLANAKNKTVWERFKSVSRSMGSFSVDVAKNTLAGLAQQQALQAASNMIQ